MHKPNLIWLNKKHLWIRSVTFLLAFSFTLTPLTPVFGEATTTQSGTESEGSGGESFLESGGEGGTLDTSRNLYDSGRYYDIDQLSGTYNFEVPIVIPPGRNGIQPQLSLQYNSQPQTETSVIGYGWSLSIPFIERINRRGTDRMFTDTDFYSSLTGELASTSATTYRTKVENGDFVAYEFANNKWSATTTSGVVYKFGYSTSTRQDHPSNSATTSKWMLEEMRDLNGNYVTYTYYKNSGQIYPATITYTHSTSSTGIFEISFTRESRTDIATSSAVGFPVVTKERIAEIVTKVNGTWARRYDLDYTAPEYRYRALLSSVTEHGRADDGSTTTKPAYKFNYQESGQKGWATDVGWVPPVFIAEDTYISLGTIVADANGDGRPDFLHSLYDTGGVNEKGIYLNTGTTTSNGWALNSGWTFPWGPYFTAYDYVNPFFPADLNGDGYDDFIYNGTSSRYTYINTKSGWATSTTQWSLPTSFWNASGTASARVIDVNGDGLSDILKADFDGRVLEAYVNNGTGWSTSTVWLPPQYFVASSTDLGTIFVELNGDGLPDILRSYRNTVPNPDEVVNIAYLNTGSGWASSTDWATTTSWSNADEAEMVTDGRDKGFRFVELNGDGGSDLMRGYSNLGLEGTINTYLNTRLGWRTVQPEWNFPSAVADTTGYDNGSRMIDINGDGLTDMLASAKGVIGADAVRIDFNTSKHVDVLSQVVMPEGGTTTIEYKSSHLYMNGTTMLNTNLPYPFLTVATTTERDGQGNVSITSYSYEGGKMYWNSSYDRKFAGFNSVTKRDPEGNVTKSYFHQASSTESSAGEYVDHVSKIGKPYRIEQYGTSSNLFNVVINKWDKFDLGNGRNHVMLAERLTLNYEGDSDHRDTLETFRYASNTGNIVEKINWGEVTGNSDGTYTDKGTDKYITNYTYATNTTNNIYALPSQETMRDQSGNKVRESRFYYDLQSLGSVTRGNPTKQEMWATSSTYIDIEKTYSGQGLVVTEKDPRDKTTTYTYDTYNLYPATTTNPVSQTIGRQYDYSSGKVRILNDQNNRVYETTYDGFDRPLDEKQPDLTTPTTLVTRALYAYTDTGYPTRVQKEDYLNAATTTMSYTYFDGYGKKIEERVEAEGSNTYAVKDYFYNKLGLVQRESLPYFASSTSYTGSSTPAANALFISYKYDAIGRVTSIANVVGTTTNAYDDWVATTTDPLGNYKSFAKDAYGNLVKVLERATSTSLITSYEYNGNNKLTKITDADANIRNFTYDGLGRRTTAQDLHDAADVTFGTWTFVYDEAGNIASTTDPKSQVVNYTYDNLNRVLTENYTGAAGTEVSYAYDSCTNGKGRLCAATTTDAVTQYTYNALGLAASEIKVLNSTNYTTAYTYDRLGNKATITYPDNSEVQYIYNAAGLLEVIKQKESGGSLSNVVNDFNYGPHGQMTMVYYGNGATTTRVYDQNELYRLRSILTMSSSTGAVGGGGSELLLLENELGLNDVPFVVQEATTSEYETLLSEVSTTTEDTRDVLLEPVDSSATSTPLEENASTTRDVSDSDVSLGEDESAELFATTSIPENVLPEIEQHLASTTTTASTTEMLVATTSFDEVLKGMSAEDRSRLKGEIIAQSTFAEEETIGNYLIKINKIESHDRGVTVYAQVWESGNQIGFGRDGTIDIERFVIINPPILVPDEEGKIVRTSFNSITKEIETYTFREDPHAALLETLKEILDVKKEKYGPEKILSGKVGRTTTTVYPDANVESTSVDGLSAHDASASSWSTIRNAADGGNANDSGDLANVVYVSHDGTQYWLYRAFYLFDTSSIPDIDDISAASFSVFINAGGVGTANTGTAKYISLVTSNPAINTAITTADYDQVGSSKLAPDTNVSSLTANAYNTWSFYTGSTSVVSKTGVTKLALRHGQDLTNEVPLNVGSAVNGISAGRWADTTGTTNDPKLVVEHSQSAGSLAQRLTYVYDAVGNITELSSSASAVGVTTAYLYDGLYRLTTASTTAASSSPFKHTFSYSSLGNMLGMATSGATTTYTYAETGLINPHAPTQIGAAALSYDNNGNVTVYGGTTYTWDYRNRMTATAKGGATTTYAYDHTYERVKKAASTTTYYPSDLYSKEGATTTKFIFGNGILLSTVEGNGTATSTRYYHQDHLGGTNVVTDSSGTIRQVLDYYPYGSSRIDLGSYDADRTYIGELSDPETNLSYLNARYYESTRGQFLSQDPVFWEVGESEDGKLAMMNPQAFNSYSYALNSPLIGKDPTGRSFQTFLEGAVKGAITVGIIAAIIATAPVAVPASVATALAVGGTAVVGYGTYENYQAYVNGEISKDDFDYNAGLLLGGTLAPGAYRNSSYSVNSSVSGRGTQVITLASLSSQGRTNTINHIFGKPSHNLSGVVKSYGSAEKAFTSLEKLTLKEVKKQKIIGQFTDLKVRIAGQTVLVRGRVADGELRITTAYIK